ncbi:hypothetical protein IFM62136_04244 [Aspergillus lentulus]|nr:hypothetical protein IFM62136_04244 [Aspergillus lentulus]
MLALFDNFWEQDYPCYEKAGGDTNSYTIGRLGQHHVVLVHMPRMGKASAANVAANLRSSFPHIRLALLVGICGGVPFAGGGKEEITLGDIVISTQIVQLDFGRQYSDTFLRKSTAQDNLSKPNQEIGAFISCLQTNVASLEEQIRTNTVTLFNADNAGNFKYPGVHEDKLFEKTYRHKHQDVQACAICANCFDPADSVCEDALNLSCAELGCAASHLIPRARIQNVINKGSGTSNAPRIHFGAIASGDQVIKSAQHRDHIATQEHVIAFEMEGAGLWENIPTIVVKGICDYADSHKNKGWQQYAAATAAACTKGILKIWRPTKRPTSDGHHDGARLPLSTYQVFNGNFFAGKSIHNGGTYTAKSMNF